MILSDVSIKRPVFATMIIAAIVLFGLVLYQRLNVDLYPNVSFPTVTVTVVYPGASPETMETQIARPIEEAVNSLSGVKALRSTNLESVSVISLEFTLDTASPPRPRRAAAGSPSSSARSPRASTRRWSRSSTSAPRR